MTPSLDARSAVGLGGQRIYRTTAIGCLAEILVTEVEYLLRAVEILHEEVDRIDRAASRFRSDSEIAHVHGSGGLPVKVSKCLFDAVSVALRVAELTDGAVDPTVGHAMNALGYERDFAEIADGIVGTLPKAMSVPGWRSIELNESTGTLKVPSGTLVDLGATAKALTADHIACRVFEAFGCGVLVSLGGDISTAGDPPPGGFLIGLADVSGAADPLETVAITSGALATSGIASRQWKLGHHDVHHIVDPKTGLPPEPVWRTVTVAAATCVDANAASTGSMVKGTHAVEWLSSLKLPARLVATDGHKVRIAGWPSDDSAVPEPLVGHR